MDKLKPCKCPCCGNTSKAVAEQFYQEFYVMCVECELRTANYDTEEEAIEAWNKRLGEDK